MQPFSTNKIFFLSSLKILLTQILKSYFNAFIAIEENAPCTTNAFQYHVQIIIVQCSTSLNIYYFLKIFLVSGFTISHLRTAEAKKNWFTVTTFMYAVGVVSSGISKLSNIYLIETQFCVHHSVHIFGKGYMQYKLRNRTTSITHNLSKEFILAFTLVRIVFLPEFPVLFNHSLE